MLRELRKSIIDIQAMKSRLDNIDVEIKDMFEKGRKAGAKEVGKEYGCKASITAKNHDYELRERDNQITKCGVKPLPLGMGI